MTKTKINAQRSHRILHFGFFLLQIGFILYLFVGLSQAKSFFDRVNKNLVEQNDLILRFETSIDENISTALKDRNESIQQYSTYGYNRAESLIRILPFYVVFILIFAILFMLRTRSN